MKRERRISAGLVASLESEQNLEPAPGEGLPVEEAQVLETRAQVAEESFRIFASEQEGVVLQDQIENTVEAGEDLEALSDIAAGAADEGGLDRAGAEVLTEAVDNAAAKAGIDSDSVNMPAAESFGGRTSRVTATQLAVEGIGDQIKKIWQAIIDGMKKAWEWIKDHWFKLFGGYEKLKSRAEAIEKKASGTSGKATETKIEDGGLYKALVIGGKIAAVGDFEGMKKAAAEITEATKKMVEGPGEKFIEVAEDAQAKLSSFEFKSSMLSIGGYKDTDGQGQAGNDMKWIVSPELPGAKALYMRVPSKDVVGVPAIDALGKMKWKLDKSNMKAGEITQTSLPTLSTNDAESIAKVIAQIAEEMIAFRKPSEKVIKAAGDAQKAAQKAADAALKGGDEELKKGVDIKSGDTHIQYDGEKELFSALRKACGNYVHAISGGGTILMGHYFQTCKAGLDYAEKSLAQYKKD